MGCLLLVWLSIIQTQGQCTTCLYCRLGKMAFVLGVHSRQSVAGDSSLEVWIIWNHSAHAYQTRHEERTKA